MEITIKKITISNDIIMFAVAELMGEGHPKITKKMIKDKVINSISKLYAENSCDITPFSLSLLDFDYNDKGENVDGYTYKQILRIAKKFLK